MGRHKSFSELERKFDEIMSDPNIKDTEKSAIMDTYLRDLGLKPDWRHAYIPIPASERAR